MPVFFFLLHITSFLLTKAVRARITLHRDSQQPSKALKLWVEQSGNTAGVDNVTAPPDILLLLLRRNKFTSSLCS